MKVNALGLTHIGLKRTNNEDAYLINESSSLFIVADGMGGHNAGEIASRMAIDCSSEYVLNPPVPAADPLEVISGAIKAANTAVFEASSKKHEQSGMGTTLIIAWIVGGRCYLGHVGDVRGYLIRNKKLKLLTKDHSVVARMVEGRQITEEEARSHPLRNALERAVGTDQEAIPDLTTIGLMHADRILLCSDGLWGLIDDSDIQSIINKSAEASITVQRLLKRALEAGGNDNITLILAEINNKPKGFRRTGRKKRINTAHNK
jgi:protein phosphatase